MTDKCNCADWGMMDHLTSCPEHWSNKNKPMPTSNLPQQVTPRYVTNLIQNGQNAEFRLDSITCHPWCAEERICGHYYKAGVIPNGAGFVSDVGPTPHDALVNALSKAGVTFR